MEQQLGQLQVLTRGALAEMRTLLLELRPENLERLNLTTQLRQLTDALKARKHIDISVEIEESEPPPNPVGIALYRIAQEAMNNTAKHADARRLRLLLKSSGTEALLVIEDDGKGFDPAAPNEGVTFGIQSMRERAKEIGADFELFSAPGEGTRLRVEWKARGQAG